MAKDCASVSMPKAKCGKACFKKNDDCGWNVDARYSSLVKTAQGPPQPAPKGAKITADFKSIGWGGASAKVRDLFAQKDLGSMTSLEATVQPHGLAMFRLSK